jgi:hypothetical protein
MAIIILTIYALSRDSNSRPKIAETSDACGGYTANSGCIRCLAFAIYPKTTRDALEGADTSVPSSILIHRFILRCHNN